jgi:hypothetical protein
MNADRSSLSYHHGELPEVTLWQVAVAPFVGAAIAVLIVVGAVLTPFLVVYSLIAESPSRRRVKL